VALVTCPFRAYLHLRDDTERLEALAAAHALLGRAGGSSSTLHALARRHRGDARTLDRAGTGIDERADWISRRRR